MDVIACAVAAIFMAMTGASDVQPGAGTAWLHLETARIVLASPELHTVARVLAEESARRTGGTFPIGETADPKAPHIVLRLDVPDAGAPMPPEGFEITLEAPSEEAGVRVTITGADRRGALFGVGHLLRHADWAPGRMRIALSSAVRSAPAYPLRGHQLGYRARANSYDAWDDKQYEQHIRELALFGTNAIENIPFEDGQPTPHMPLSREAMNVRLSEICADYDLYYWVWTPAVFSLKDAEQRAAEIERHKAFYQACPRLDAIFFPGGDPGDNHPEDVMPFLAELAAPLQAAHPNAKVWISLQGFDPARCDYFYAWVERHMPAWLGGVVCGPGSPPIPETRARLPRRYALRHYPDITHTVRCQYPVKWWDPSFAVTLGREPINPQPVYYALIHNAFAPYTNGFITYSDGMNDDVNKVVWSLRGWDPEMPVREMMLQYASLFFAPKHAERIADGILALERNWEGPLPENGGVAAALALWEALDREIPEMRGNWRWQCLMLRACYDAYTRDRLIYERSLEALANAELSAVRHPSPGAAMAAALSILKRAETQPCRPGLRRHIEELFAALFESIGLQSSVEKHQASGYERGCSLDFVDYPLNNRWWLEDEFEKVRAMDTPEAQWRRLQELREWENPGPGAFYDNVGHVGRCPHVLRGEGLNTDPLMERDPNPEAWWWENGFSRARLSWQSTMDILNGLVYTALDPQAAYVFRCTGYGDAKVRANGELLTPMRYDKEIGGIKEFPVPSALLAEGRLFITFDPLDEAHLNWRQQSRIAEAWLIPR